jgi:hypothetical protein
VLCVTTFIQEQESILPTPKRAETTAFSLDIAGRYVCNGLDEALASTTGRSDARGFDIVIIGGGTFGAAIAEHLCRTVTPH